MSTISEENIKTILEKVASAINLKHSSYAMEQLNSIGQNYFGVIVPVLLRGKQDERDKILPILLKLAPSDERYRISGAVTLMFAREIYVYSNLLPMYLKLKNELQLSHYVTPKCYYVCSEYCNEVLAMENMFPYTPYVNSNFLDYDHITISLKSLAEFHALSFILREKNNDCYNDAKRICLPLTKSTNERFIHVITDRLTKAIEKFSGTQYVPLLKSLRDHCVTYVEATTTSVIETCLCHGDIWKENILFKYENSKPISACLIDFQTTRICSPAFDVLYLIVSSTNSSLRSQYFYPLLNIYYETFEQVLKKISIDCNKMYSKDMFMSDLKVVGPASFIVANTAMWLVSGLQQEGHIRSKQILSTDKEIDEAVQNYKSIVKGIMDDLTTYEYLDIKLNPLI